MNFLKRRGRKTTITISDQTRSSRASLSSGEGRNSQLGSTAALRKTNVISKDLADQDYHSSQTVTFDDPATPHKKKNSKHARFSDDTNQNNNNLSQVESHQQVHNGNHVEESYLRSQQPRDMTLLAHPSPRLVVDTPSETAGTPMSLYASVIKGDKVELKKIISANPELLDTPDNFGRTPLMYCVLADRLDCAKFLIKMRCKLDQVDNAGRSAVHSAAHKGSYKFLEHLHHRGASIDIKDHDGQTALHLATRIRSPKCLEFLLRNVGPGMVDVPDNQSRTALHWSAAFNNTECVKLLIKYGINIAIPDADGKTPLHWAANNHDPSAVNTMSALLEKSPGVVNWQDYEGRTALHFAVADGNSAAVELLVKFKPLDYFEPYTCDVDRSDNTFRTALHWAAQLGNAHITKILLEAGAKNSVTDTNGATPFLYAASNNHHSVVEVMIAHDPRVVEQTDIAGRNALMWAAGKGANDVIRIVLGIRKNSQHKNPANPTGAGTEESEGYGNRDEAGSVLKFSPLDINKADNKVNTALHVAALNGKESSVELLLSQHARHDLQNHMNHTAIFGACEKGYLDVVKYLLDYNASINLVDSESRSPLHWAALGGHAEVCELLIKEGLNVDIRDTLDRTPLHCAAFGGFINCMNLLLENGANVDLQDMEGRSALHWAAQSGHLDAAKLLFQYNVFPNPMEYTEERLTPLNHALQQVKEEVAQYLIEQGALSAEHIRNIAATKVQACFRGYRVRKTFLMRKKTLMRMVELRSKKNRQKKQSDGQMSDDGGKRQENDDAADTRDADPVSEENVRDMAATKVQALFRGYRVRKSNMGHTRLKTVDEKKQEQEIQAKEQILDDVEKGPSSKDETNISTSSQIDTDATRDMAATRIQAYVRGFHVRKSLSVQTQELNKVKPKDRKEMHQRQNDTLASNGDGNSTTSYDTPILKEDVGPHDTGNDPTNKAGITQEVATASKVDVTRPAETIDTKPESPTAAKTVNRKLLASRLKFDSEDTSTSAANQFPKKEIRRKKPKKRRFKPAANDTSSENDFRDQRTVAKTSASSSPMSLRSVASTASSNAPSKPSPLIPAPPSAAKSDQKERKGRRRLLSQSTGQNLRQTSHPALDKIGNEDNIQGESVTGLAYKPQPPEMYFFDDPPLPIPPPPAVNVSPSLELSEYVESLMKLAPKEKRLLKEHQQSRREAFEAAIDATVTIQRAWWRYLAAKKPDLRKKFLTARKRARRLERHRNKEQPANKPSQPAAKGDILSESVSPDSAIARPSKTKPNQKRFFPDISSNSASSVVSERYLSPDTPHSSVTSSVDFQSVASGASVKGRRPKTVGPGQNSLYISVEKLEKLSRIYGHPQAMRDLLIASGKPSTLPSYDRSYRSSVTETRPVTVSNKQNSPYGTSLTSSTSNYSAPTTSMRSPRRWVSGTNKTRLQSAAENKRPMKSNPTLQSAPSGTLSPESVDSEQKIDISRLPLQWQKLYGELQNAGKADLRRKQFARFSYNIGDIGF